MMKQYNLQMPHLIYSGENVLDQIGAVLKANGIKKLAVFTDKGVRQAGLLDGLLERIEKTEIPCEILDDLPPEPTYSQAQALADSFRASGADFIIAVGGGSVMDTAKLSSVAATGEYVIKDLLDDPSRAKKRIKTMMIPTTAGTGAEATPNAIVAVPEKQLKVGIVSDQMIADYVLLDAEMIRHLPRKIAAATGVDALAHAIECFTSNKANPFSDLFALQALEMILQNIEPACDEPDNLAAKERMLLASFYAGIAITCSGTTAVHALSYPLGGKYHIPHGVSNAILLAPVMRFNEPACRERLAAAYDRCFKNGVLGLSIEEKSELLITRIEAIVRHLDIPISLTSLGVSADELEALVEAGMQVTRLLVNNMRPVTPDDARAIYRSIL